MIMISKTQQSNVWFSLLTLDNKDDLAYDGSNPYNYDAFLDKEHQDTASTFFSKQRDEAEEIAYSGTTTTSAADSIHHLCTLPLIKT